MNPIQSPGVRTISFCELLPLQREHDESYHKDVAWFAPDARAKHYVLHFSKYVARLVEIRRAYNDVYWHKTIADIAITALSAINAWNMSPTLLEDASLEPFVQGKMREYLDQRKALSLALIPWLQEELALATGRMARVCEQLDHGVTLEYTTIIKSSVVDILILLVTVSRLLEIDLVHIVKGRWQQAAHRA